jgi:DNA helicase-2/ATP-dependent DNA helicase PcrA
MAVVPTDEQQAVIDHLTGTVLVLAAVGSGKTTTLSHRIAHALKSDENLRAERILALTFTNRAADHMAKSLEDIAGAVAASRMTISTFHALCARILRSDPPGAGLPADFRILDEDDVVELMEEVGVNAPTKAMYALNERASATPLGACSVQQWHRGLVGGLEWGPRYAEVLTMRGAIDFAGLVYLTRALLTEVDDARGRWSTAYDVVLVDEVQDTHLSEYEVLRVLAAQAGSLCLVGDLDQTIYSWRGSAPRHLLEHLDRDFGPIVPLHMTRNFRSTRNMLRTASALADAMPDRASDMRASEGLTDGAIPTLISYSTAFTEADGVAQQVAQTLRAGASADRLAILVRTHKALARQAEALKALAVPHTTVEHFKFFRRAEVKDALSVARLVHDRHDEVAARRIARRMVRGVGNATLQRIREEGKPVGLQLTDLLDAATIHQGDPFWVLDQPDCIVLDTETTGFDPDEDEIIEVAAIRLRGGVYSERPEDTFEALLRNTIPVGQSEAVHHISDAQLTAEGRDPTEVLEALAEFIGKLPIAGHNVHFDRRMLEGYAHRLGVPLRLTVRFDTLPLARRLVPTARNHKLGTLVDHLRIPFEPTHRALDDVLATAALAHRLGELAKPGRARRWSILAKEHPAFARLRTALDSWAQQPRRPAALLRTITSQILHYKGADAPRRLANLEELARRVEAMDERHVPAERALTRVLDRAALVRDVDALDGTPGVRVLTMHQSKGLEFDHVWVPDLIDGGIPSWFAVKRLREDGDHEGINEERRLLYVAITRARLTLTLSWHRKDDRGRSQEASRFTEELGATVRRVAGP